MDRVIDIEGARRLVGDDALWPHVRDFLWDFGPQIHPTRLPAGIETLAGQSWRIKRFVMDSLGVAPAFYDFASPGNARLMLLPGETLVGIAKWLGALVCAAALRRIMDGAKVRELKAALPDVYPAVFSYTAYFRNIPEVGATCADDVIAAGYKTLFSLFSGLPTALVDRLSLKLPASVDASLREAEAKPLPDAAVSLLLRLKFPEAHALCCS